MAVSALLMAAAVAISLTVPAAWRGWLAAFVMCAGFPLGALCIVMTMHLVPGEWRAALEAPMSILLVLLVAACLMAVPVLLWPHAFYPPGPSDSGFRAIYDEFLWRAVRTVLFLALAGGLSVAMTLGPRAAPALAAAGLIAFVPFHTMVSVDWVLSLEPHFHSSAFGLYLLSIQAVSAVAASAILSIAVFAPVRKPGIAGALLLVMLMLWGYFAFMQYFIVWSDNLPATTAWYAKRGEGIWGLLAWLVALSQFVPALLLLHARVRRSPAWLVPLAAIVLAGKAGEYLWLVLPGGQAPLWSLIVFALAAVAAAGGLACLPRAKALVPRHWDAA